MLRPLFFIMQSGLFCLILVALIEFVYWARLCSYPKMHKVGVINYMSISSLNGSTIIIFSPFFVNAEASSSCTIGIISALLFM